MPRLLLLVSAALFAGFGAYLTVLPERLADLGILAEGPTARTELRAFYGGLELGLAAFLLACATRRSWIAPGCAALALVNGGIATTRLLGMLLERSAGELSFSFLAVEVALCVLATLATIKTISTEGAARARQSGGSP